MRAGTRPTCRRAPRDAPRLERDGRVRSRHGESVDLTLHPRVPHASRLELGVVSTGGVCCFGRWTGRIRAGDETLEIRDLPGWAEEFAHRW